METWEKRDRDENYDGFLAVADFDLQRKTLVVCCRSSCNVGKLQEVIWMLSGYSSECSVDLM